MPRQHSKVEFLDVVYIHGVQEGFFMGERDTFDLNILGSVIDLSRGNRDPLRDSKFCDCI